MRGDPFEQGDLDLVRERFELARPYPRARRVAVMAIRVHPAAGRDIARRELERVAELSGIALERLRSALRRTDSVAVVGPMRFLALVERLEDGPFAMHVADRLVAAVREPFPLDSGQVALVASVGVSVYPDDGDQLDDLVRCAEDAMDAAQLGGGDLFGFHSGTMSVRAARRVAVERALSGVLDRGELLLHYQPQIDVRDGEVLGVEALLRWHNDVLGNVSPAEFVPVLEANGGIDDVGRFVLDWACKQGAEWRREGRPMRVGVNVSARQLLDADFGTAVVDALDKHRFAPDLLELELTESVLVDNVPETRRLLESLRARGVRIALDDFGTGYASLACVRHFPMDTIKIDRQFVHGLPVDSENAAITSAITALAGCLRAHLVAEGVETEAEEEFLGSLGCHVVQGFRHARPMSPTAFAEWLRGRPWA